MRFIQRNSWAKSQKNRHRESLVFENSGRRKPCGKARSSSSMPTWLRKKLFDELKFKKKKEGENQDRQKRKSTKALFRNLGTKGRPELT